MNTGTIDHYIEFMKLMKYKLQFQTREELNLHDLSFADKNDKELTFNIFKELTGLRYINKGMELLIFSNTFPKEEWKRIIIDGIETEYEVSTYGRFYSHKRKEYNGWIDSRGYNKVAILLLKWKQEFNVHRLVATMFIPNPENKPQVNHIDGYIDIDEKGRRIKHDFFMNLEWCTIEENVKHAHDNNLSNIRTYFSKGEDHPQSIYSEDIIKEACELLQEGKLTAYEIGEKLNINPRYISIIKSGYAWKHISENYDFSNALLQDRSGEKCHFTKHKEDLIKKICQSLQDGKLSQQEISKIYNVSYGYIDGIKRKKNWKNISKNYDFSNIPSGRKIGSDNPSNKYSEEKIKKICKLLQEKKMSMVKISDLLDIPYGIVTNIKYRKIWNHISKDYNF